MTTANEVHQALAAAVATTGLNASPYLLDATLPPTAHVWRREFDPRLVFGQARWAVPFGVRILCNRTIEEAGQADLADYCDLTGEKSVIAAIQDEDNWPDQLVHYAVVTLVGEVEAVTIGSSDFVQVELEVEVVW